MIRTQTIRRVEAIGLLAALLVAGCAGPEPMAEKASLYERLGGTPAISAVVDEFIANVAADPRINGFFASTDIPRLKHLLVQQICAGTGGPCTYTGRTMKAAHAGLGIREAHFSALAEDLVRALATLGVPKPEQDELLGILGSMEGDIVEG